ncbi:MAG: hypothetical protein ACI89X_000904 [Planctomycetota bacterium]
MNEQEKNVADEQLRQAFDEIGGRATPPNRLDEILKRAAEDAGAQPGTQKASPFKAGKLWAAALLMLGLGTTITASVLKNQADEAAADKQPVEVAAAGQEDAQARDVLHHGTFAKVIEVDPAPPPGVLAATGQDPKPKPKQDPKPTGKPMDQGKTKKTIVPKGTDAADLAFIRSAESMLEAEKNLRRLMKEGKIAGVDQVLPFDQLSGWKYTDGLKGIPKKIKKLDGKKVLMLGFMLPIDEVQNIKEFLLVESLWSCCYGQPPDINGIARCVMPKGKTLDYQFDPMKLVGTLKVDATVMDGYCVDIYQLHVDYVEVIDAAKPKNTAPTKQELKKLEQRKDAAAAERKRKKKDNDC